MGHTFLLGTKYSQPLKVVYTEQGESRPMMMGCFGLGLSRIFALAVEILSTNEEIRWPAKLAPYTACIVPPKVTKRHINVTRFNCSRRISVVSTHLFVFFFLFRRLEAKRKAHPPISSHWAKFSANAKLTRYWTTARIWRSANDLCTHAHWAILM